ncbi:MAG TPA: hypothetical protein VH723_06935 [Candidatus Limnocylindrales bacterium]
MTRTVRSLGPRLLGLTLAVVLAAPVSAAPAAAPRADAPAAASPSQLAPSMTKGGKTKAIRRGTVDVAKAARGPQRTTPKVDMPVLIPTSAATNAPGLNAPGLLAPAGPAPVAAAPSGRTDTNVIEPATDSTAFGTSDSALEPPDPFIAVGPDHVVQSFNTAFKFMDRRNGTFEVLSLHDFFILPTDPITFAFDPRVVYDSLHGRWIATDVSFDCEPIPDFADVGSGYLDIAVSSTSDPTGEWTSWFIQYGDVLPDYPMLGTSTDKAAIGSNLFGLEALDPGTCGPSGDLFGGTALDVFPWADLLAGGELNFHHEEIPDGSTARPALQTPATSATIHGVNIKFVGPGPDNWNAENFKITGTISSTVDTIVVARYDMSAGVPGVLGGFDAAVLAPRQPGEEPPNTAVDTIDDAVDGRPTDAIWQNGHLFFVSTYRCTPIIPSTDVERDCIRVSDVNTNGATPVKVQDFLINEAGRDLFHGGIGITLNGDLHVTYTRSSVSDFPGTWSVYRGPGDATNSVSTAHEVRAGDGLYDLGDRWGDYTGVAQDPQDGNVVWQTNEIANAPGDWMTHFSRLSAAPGSTYIPITPTRVLDTRDGTGLSNRFQHGVPRSWQVAGVGTIPSDAVAVTGNVTVTQQTGAGHVSVTPRPVANPSSSTINFPVGDTRANNVTIPLNTDGKVSATYIAQAGKLTHLIFDVTGYFTPDTDGDTYNTLTPYRPVDTRLGGNAARLVRDVPQAFQITSATPDQVPVGAKAITANVTITGQTGPGHVAITPASDPNPPTSTINFPLGDTRANGQTLPLSLDGKIYAVYKSSTAAARTHLIVDVTGYYLDTVGGLEFYPLNPGRVMDTRLDLGVDGPLTFDSFDNLQTGGHFGVPTDAEAVTGNLTITQPNKPGHITLLPDPPAGTPGTSTLNFPASDTRANGITQPINAGDNMSVWFDSTSGGTVQAILDVTGYFLPGP